MARPTKEGLEYFPTDVDIFDDPKLLFVTTKYGDYGDLIAVKLLTWIYKQGYKIDWNEEMLLLFTARSFKNVELDLVKNVVEELINRDFFSKEIFEKYGVLTSRGIQKRWIHVQRSYKRKVNILTHLSLVEEEETPSKPEETPDEKEETPHIPEFSTQKESKVKEIKRKEKETHFFREETEKLFKSKTRIQSPNFDLHIYPVLEFFDQKPEHITDEDIKNCIRAAFLKFDESKQKNGQVPGVKMEFLTSNIQAKITAKWEERLGELKENERIEAEKHRKERENREINEEQEEKRKLSKKYREFYEQYPDAFSRAEQEAILRLCNENKVFQLGVIIEPKMQQFEVNQSPGNN